MPAPLHPTPAGRTAHGVGKHWRSPQRPCRSGIGDHIVERTILRLAALRGGCESEPGVVDGRLQLGRVARGGAERARRRCKQAREHGDEQEERVDGREEEEGAVCDAGASQSRVKGTRSKGLRRTRDDRVFDKP